MTPRQVAAQPSGCRSSAQLHTHLRALRTFGVGGPTLHRAVLDRLAAQRNDIADPQRPRQTGGKTGQFAAALAQPWASLVLSGAATADQLRSNVRAAAVPPDAIADLPPLAEEPATYWATRSELPWN